MNDISCDICMDLMPLVKDNVACKDSEQAVISHIAHCENCRNLFEGQDKVIIMDESNIIGNIRKEIFLLSMMVVFIGTLIGLGFSESSAMFCNILIMPSVGALGYIAMKKKAAVVPLVMFVVVYLWHFIKYLIIGEFAGQSISALISAPFLWSLIYSAFCALGTLIAFLLHFALKKGGNSDE